jgi:hypothetical protein
MSLHFVDGFSRLSFYFVRILSRCSVLSIFVSRSCALVASPDWDVLLLRSVAGQIAVLFFLKVISSCRH